MKKNNCKNCTNLYGGNGYTDRILYLSKQGKYECIGKYSTG